MAAEQTVTDGSRVYVTTPMAAPMTPLRLKARPGGDGCAGLAVAQDRFRGLAAAGRGSAPDDVLFICAFVEASPTR